MEDAIQTIRNNCIKTITAEEDAKCMARVNASLSSPGDAPIAGGITRAAAQLASRKPT